MGHRDAHRQLPPVRREDEPAETLPATTRQEPENATALAENARPLLGSSRIVVRLGKALATEVAEPQFRQRTEAMGRKIFEDLGVEIPPIGVDVNETIAPRNIRIDLEGVPIVEAEIPADQVLVETEASHLELLSLSYEEGAALVGQRKFSWVDQDGVSALEEAQLPYLEPLDIASKWTAHALQLYCGHFVGIQETRKLLSEMETDYADLVRQAVEIVPLQKIADVLRRLVAENVPIRNLRLVLEALVEAGQRDQDVVQLTEHVRTALRRQISFRVADRNNIISAYVLQRSAEDILREAVQTTSTGAFLNTADAAVQALAAEIERHLSRAAASVSPVIVTAADIRRHLRALLVQNGIELPVLSFPELAPEFNVQPLATISGNSGRSRTPSLPSAGALGGQNTAG